MFDVSIKEDIKKKKKKKEQIGQSRFNSTCDGELQPAGFRK